jgi:hypothetical protein
MFFYEINVPRQNVANSRVLTLESVHGPIKFIIPRNTVNGQAFVLKSQTPVTEEQAANHIVTVNLI